MKLSNMKIIKNLLLAGGFALAAVSCNDLDLQPENQVTSATVYEDFSNYKGVLAKLYAGLALTGQEGPDGNGDIGGVDEGFSSYLRQYWQLQELPTDEAIIGWNDAGLPELNTMAWSESNEFNRALYYRIFYQITFANEYIRELSDANLSDRGITGSELEEAGKFRAEARFIRALSYWHALDLYGNVPFVTENDPVGSFFPEQIKRAALFDYVESELLAIQDQLVDARGNEYARADKAAAWTLLTKLYLNAAVYTGQERYTDALTYANKVIESGYTLEADYSHLFLADNHSAEGVIFSVAFDGERSRTWGGMTFLVSAPVGGDHMTPSDFGIGGGWGGMRTTSAMVSLFPDVTGDLDSRAMFHTEGHSLEINEVPTFTEGYPFTKWKNITSAGEAGSDPSFPDTDFPMFRLADVYLMYAEAVLNGGQGGDEQIALGYVNALRKRAFGDDSGAVTLAELKGTGEHGLPFILNERGRELYWEGHRRTDLIRFGLFTGDQYVWPWKGGAAEGRGVSETRSLYPIPESDLINNPNLTQNPR